MLYKISFNTTLVNEREFNRVTKLISYYKYLWYIYSLFKEENDYILYG